MAVKAVGMMIACTSWGSIVQVFKNLATVTLCPVENEKFHLAKKSLEHQVNYRYKTIIF